MAAPGSNLPPLSSDNSSPSPPVDTATAIVTPFDTPLAATFVPTQPPTVAPTATMTIEPTPIYAMVHTPKGTILRETPGGKGIVALDNSTWVQLLPETQDVSGFTWAHVIASPNGIPLKGWIVQLYLVTPTPSAGTATP
jgi:hypothetical protein